MIIDKISHESLISEKMQTAPIANTDVMRTQF